MLHNSGGYGPNDVPINMGAPVNMSQMGPPANLGHNLSNLGKIAPPPVQTQSSPYNVPDYSAYGHPPLGMGSQMSPFQSYNPMGFQSNYFSQNPPLHEASWQSNMLPMNLNTQMNHSANLLNYPVTYNKRPENLVSNEYREESVARKNMPINIPQVPQKAFQKYENESNYGLYNVNQDKFNHYNHTLDLNPRDNSLNLNARSNDKPILDNTRRKSLENTVRLIEDLLINTTKNRDLQQQQRILENSRNYESSRNLDHFKSVDDSLENRFQHNTSSVSNKYHQDDNSASKKYHQDDNSVSNKYHQDDNSVSNKYHHNDNSVSNKYHQAHNSVSTKYHQADNSAANKFHQNVKSTSDKFHLENVIKETAEAIKPLHTITTSKITEETLPTLVEKLKQPDTFLTGLSKNSEIKTESLAEDSLGNAVPTVENKITSTVPPVESINDFETDDKKDINVKDISETELSSAESEDEEVSNEIHDVKIKLEVDPTVVVKVESLCWTDTDYFNPFQRDMNGVTREDIGNTRIVDGEDCVNEAMAVVKSGLSPPAAYECPHCGLLFVNPKRFLIHNKWHSFGLTNDKRMEVAKSREMRRNMRREARVVDRMNAKEVTDVLTDKKVYPCKDCDKAFTSKGSLKNHRQRFHPTRVRECKICRKTMLGWMALRNHLATHNKDAGYQCQDCPKQFKYAHSLAKHRDTHLEKTLTCHQCPKKFGSNAQLKMHQKVHERVQRGATYHCSYCAKAFYEAYNLAVHERVQRGATYHCSYCAKAFYEAYNLAVHERTHRNERPFVCDICNTSFGTNSSLKRHLKVSHSSTKPYECDTCHRSFSTAGIRDRHALRQHGDPDSFQFNCDLCSCRYLKSKDLQKHIYKAHPKGKRKKKVKSESE